MKNYQRREFLVRSAAAGAAVIAAPAIAKAADRFHWKMVSVWPANLPIFQGAAERFAKLVDQASSGRLKIKVYGAGELVPALSVMDTVSQGTVETGMGYPNYWAGKVPAAQVFAGLPFGMNAQEMRAWLIAGGGQELWEKTYQPLGVIPMSLAFAGMQMGGWFKKEIKSPADLKGLRIRLTGIAGKVFARAGANSVLMPGAELYTALERGTIDATEWAGPFLDERMGLQRTASYYYYPAWHEPAGNLELIINNKAWNSLPKDLQTIVRSTAMAVSTWALASLDHENSLMLERFREENKIQILPFPDSVIEVLKRETKVVLEEISAQDPIFREAYQSYSAFQRRIEKWADVGEYSFAKLRHL